MSEENGTTPTCRTCKNAVVGGTIDGECEMCHTHRVLNIQDSERMPEPPQAPPQQPPAPAVGQVAINVSAQGMTISIMPQPINLGLDKDAMRRIVTDFLNSDPAFFDELAKQRLATKRQELAIIRSVEASRIHD